MTPPTKLTGRIAIIRYQEGKYVTNHVVGISPTDTEQSIRAWFQECKPNAWIRSVTIEEGD